MVSKLFLTTEMGLANQRRICSFELVTTTKDQSAGTTSGGDAICPFSDCARVIDADEVKRQAQSGKMGEQLYAVVYKRRVQTKTKSGKIRYKWIRDYRATRPEDDNSSAVIDYLNEKIPEWEALDIIPTRAVSERCQ